MQGRTQGGVGGGWTLPRGFMGRVQPQPLAQHLPTYPPIGTNQTKIPYPKPLKHSNKTKLN
jgi:hypothetical protein